MKKVGKYLWKYAPVIGLFIGAIIAGILIYNEFML